MSRSVQYRTRGHVTIARTELVFGDAALSLTLHFAVKSLFIHNFTRVLYASDNALRTCVDSFNRYVGQWLHDKCYR
jgi:hypothetical protein